MHKYLYCALISVSLCLIIPLPISIPRRNGMKGMCNRKEAGDL